MNRPLRLLLALLAVGLGVEAAVAGVYAYRCERTIERNGL